MAGDALEASAGAAPGVSAEVASPASPPGVPSVPRERTALGIVVTCAGGFMDAYSYLMHGEVFANGQTGNIVLLVLRLAEADWGGAVRYVIPVAAFVLGVFLSRCVQEALFPGCHARMQRCALAFEATLFAAIALAASHAGDLLVNSVISFAAAVAFQNFRTFGTRSTYASVFCTGNLRSLGLSLYEGLVRHDAHECHRAQRYMAIIGSFGAGVLLGKVSCQLMGNQSCVLVSAIFLLANAFVSRSD